MSLLVIRRKRQYESNVLLIAKKNNITAIEYRDHVHRRSSFIGHHGVCHKNCLFNSQSVFKEFPLPQKLSHETHHHVASSSSICGQIPCHSQWCLIYQLVYTKGWMQEIGTIRTCRVRHQTTSSLSLGMVNTWVLTWSTVGFLCYLTCHLISVASPLNLSLFMNCNLITKLTASTFFL